MNSAQDFAQLKHELHLAQKYWLESVHPYIANRKLYGAELYVATDAHAKLRQAWKEAGRWNSTAQGRENSILLPDPLSPGFAEPEPLYGDDLKPETLATIAVSLLPKLGQELTPGDAIRTAHDILLAAERYIASLPKRSVSGWTEAFAVGFSHVKLSEIQASNRPNSGQLPLLPSLRGPGRKRSEAVQSLQAINNALKDYLKVRIQIQTKAQYTAEQAQNKCLEKAGHLFRLGNPLSFEDWKAHQRRGVEELKRGLATVADISALRYERFRKTSESNRTGAINRAQSRHKAGTRPRGRQ